MTKRKTIYLWGLLLLFLGIINSCRNDFLQDQHSKNELQKATFSSKIITLNQSKHKVKLLSELSESKQILSKQSPKSTLGKTVNYGDSIYIDTDHVVFIENENYHNYIFKINKTNPQIDEPLDNLLLTPLPDGSYKEFLIRYLITDQEKELLKAGNWKVPNSKIKMTEL